jgi:hypothetical protein
MIACEFLAFGEVCMLTNGPKGILMYFTVLLHSGMSCLGGLVVN